MVDAPPTADKIMQTGLRSWELPEHRPNLTLSRAAFKTYSTYVNSRSCLHLLYRQSLTFSIAPALSTPPGPPSPLRGKPPILASGPNESNCRRLLP